jgi:transcriptional regulator with XRE-family HTH domain
MTPSLRDALNPATCLGAREFLSWSADDLAMHAGLSLPTIINFETGRHWPRYKTITALLRAFGEAGMVFILNGEGHAAFRFSRGRDTPVTLRDGSPDVATDAVKPGATVDG